MNGRRAQQGHAGVFVHVAGVLQEGAFCAGRMRRQRWNTRWWPLRALRSRWGLRRCGMRVRMVCLHAWRSVRHRMPCPCGERLTSRCIEDRAQATVEAAVLLPCFLLVLLLALQPICLLYTRAVMESTASEVARLMATGNADDDAYRSFALRRLSAVPDISIFHAGGPQAWEMAFERAGHTGGNVRVSIEGAIRPLPVLGVFAPAFAEVNALGDAVVRVEVSYEARPDWLEGEYEDWVGAWGA